jgi:hypothetical protein
VTREEYGQFYDAVYSQDFGEPTPGGHGWIQWKGTDVCIDIRCACGGGCHFEGFFLYYWRCADCGRVFALGQNVKLIPLTPEQVAYLEKEGTIIQESDE